MAMRVYYAHSMQIYDTLRERLEARWLKRYFGDVINPNELLDNINWRHQAEKLIRSCGCVVVSEYDGHIGKGVHFEVALAMSIGKPVLVLRGRKLYPVVVGNVAVVNANDWKVNFAEIILE